MITLISTFDLYLCMFAVMNIVDLRCAAACKSLKRLRSCTHDIECTIVSGLAFTMALFLSTNEISLAQSCLRARVC